MKLYVGACLLAGRAEEAARLVAACRTRPRGTCGRCWCTVSPGSGRLGWPRGVQSTARFRDVGVVGPMCALRCHVGAVPAAGLGVRGLGDGESERAIGGR